MTAKRINKPETKLEVENSRWAQAYKPVNKYLVEVEERLKKRESIETLSHMMGAFPGIKVIEEAENHVLQAGGKRLRAALCILATMACGGKAESALPLAVGIELFHAATLVIDDLVEDADTRRGKPSVHRLWGDSSALVTAMGLQLRSLPSFMESMISAGYSGKSKGSSKMVAYMGQTVARVLWGEVLQHQTRMRFDLNEEVYFRIISDKTAALFELSCAGGALIAGANDSKRNAMEKYARRLGLAFQISDDILDLMGEKRRLGKSPGSDLKEGRITLPLIYYFRDSNDRQWKKMQKMLPPLRKPPLPRDEIVEELQKSGSIAQCHKAAKTESGKARRALAQIPNGKSKESLRTIALLAADRSR